MKKNGEEIRLRNKIKPAIEPQDLKVAHNYVREFLNQRLKKDKEKKGKTKNKDSKIIKPDIQKIETPNFDIPIQEPITQKRRSIIRRF